MTVGKMPQYRLLACDLDGTLIGDDISIPNETRRAIYGVQSRGIRVTLATGRGYPDTLPFARTLNITVPVICFQGGLIKHPITGDVIFRATMDPHLIRDVIRLAHERNWHILVYIDDSGFLEEMRHDNSFYEALLGRDIRPVDDLMAAILKHESPPAKFLIVGKDAAESDYVEENMRMRFGGQMQIVRSHTLFVEGNPLGVDKGDALRRLSAYLSVPQERVMAIGDQGNDVPMLSWAGLGVAMQNGSDAVKAVSDWIAPPIWANGAAVAIERFLLQ